jgi:hypothetical protein
MMHRNEIKNRLRQLIQHRDCMKANSLKYNNLDMMTEYQKDCGEIQGIYFVIQGSAPRPEPTMEDIEKLPDDDINVYIVSDNDDFHASADEQQGDAE